MAASQQTSDEITASMTEQIVAQFSTKLRPLFDRIRAGRRIAIGEVQGLVGCRTEIVCLTAKLKCVKQTIAKVENTLSELSKDEQVLLRQLVDGEQALRQFVQDQVDDQTESAFEMVNSLICM